MAAKVRTQIKKQRDDFKDVKPTIHKAKKLRLTPAQHDLSQAEAFLNKLGSIQDEWLFVTIDDNKDRKDTTLTRKIQGTFDQRKNELLRMNNLGAAVYVTVNITDGGGRKLENMVKPRAVFQEADEPEATIPALEPHIVVQTSPGKFHRYWLIDQSHAPMWDEWTPVMNRMVKDFGSDKNAKDRSRVLRVPGFFHQKDASNPHLVMLVDVNDIKPYSWETITDVILPLVDARPRQPVMRKPNTNAATNDLVKVRSALMAIDPDCEYDTWIRIGAAIHHDTGGSDEGMAVWDGWSSNGDKYVAGEPEDKWSTFGDYSGTPATFGTIFHLANGEGWCWEHERQKLLGAQRQIVIQTILAVRDDLKSYLDPSVIEALRQIRAEDPVEYQRLRIDLKQANPNVGLGALDELTGGVQANGSAGNDSMATKLTNLAIDRCELWHDEDGNSYASFQQDVNGVAHRENWSINSQGFSEWLSQQAYRNLGSASSKDAIATTQNVLAGIAKFDGEQYKPARRVSKTDDGYWLDLCDEEWRAVLVTAVGWKIVADPNVRFVRTKAMRSLPVPISGGSIEPLWQLTNIPEEDRLLVLVWMIEAYRCDTPYPVIEFTGEQGSAKSTTQETLRTFIDPSEVMLRGRPKNVEDIYVGAKQNHVLSLENLSGLSPEMSDALCTVSTGGGMSTRQFYTNDEEVILKAHNPVMVNGIGAVVVRPDLLDRSLTLCLQTISSRITEADHTSALAVASVSIMGALLDIFVMALVKLPKIVIPPGQLPRMADFACLGEALHQARGGKSGEFLRLYSDHRKDAIRRTVDSSPVAAACIALVEKGEQHSDTVKSLLDRLNGFCPEYERGDYWPRSPRGLGDVLRRVAPALRQIGIHLSVDSKPKGNGVHCHLRRSG